MKPATAFVAVVLAIVLSATPSASIDGSGSRAIRPFTSNSYWNTPSGSWPRASATSTLMSALYRQSGRAHYLKFSGLDATGGWGRPIYFATTSDRLYAVRCLEWGCSVAPRSIRMPSNARPSQTVDGDMIVANLKADGFDANAWYGLMGVSINNNNRTITAKGWDTYINSTTGIAGALRCCGSVAANGGHRGASGILGVVRWKEIQAGAINHALVIAISNTSRRHCFPFSGDEDGVGSIPEGAHVKIRGSVDINSLVKDPEARIIARALQRYGAIIGDQTDNSARLKLENLYVEGANRPSGAPTSWSGVLPADAFRKLPFTRRFWVFKTLGWDPGSGRSRGCET